MQKPGINPITGARGNVFIAGGASKLGLALVEHFLKDSFFVYSIDNLRYGGKLENAQKHSTNPHYRFIKRDVTYHSDYLVENLPLIAIINLTVSHQEDVLSLRSAAVGVDALAHMAAKTKCVLINVFDKEGDMSVGELYVDTFSKQVSNTVGVPTHIVFKGDKARYSDEHIIKQITGILFE